MDLSGSHTGHQWSLHHIGIATEDAHLEAERWGLLGYTPVSNLVHDPIQRVRVLFLGNGVPGSPLLELVEPADTDAPVRRYLKQTTRFYHICFEVPDIQEALARVRSARWLVVQPPVPASAFDQRPIAWCYTRSRDLIELVQREPEEP